MSETIDTLNDACAYQIQAGSVTKTCAVFGWAHDKHELVKQFPHDFTPAPKRTEATFASVQESRHDYLLQVERRARVLYAHAKEQGGLGDQVEDCRYILEGEGLWKDVLE